MKKAFLVFFALIALFNLTSCTPQALDAQAEAPKACCGDDFTSPDPTNP